MNNISQPKLLEVIIKLPVLLQELFYRVDFVVDPNVTKLQINGSKIHINVDWFNNCSVNNEKGYIEHVLWHFMFLHEQRSIHFVKNQKQNQDIWSKAADQMLANALKSEMPSHESIFYDKRYSNLESVEEIFLKMRDDSQQEPQNQQDSDNPQGQDQNQDQEQNQSQNQGQSSDSGSNPDSDMKYDSNNEEEAQKKYNNARDIVAATVVSAQTKGIGNIPGSLERFFEQLCEPQVNWADLLKEIVVVPDNSDYSWKRRNRRYHDIYLPSLHSHSPGNIIIVIDVSGSISEDVFTKYMSEIYSVIDDVNPKNITLVQFDTQLDVTKHIESLEDLMKIDFIGGGGTDFTPVARYLNKDNMDYAACIIFTDSYFNDPVIQLPEDKPHFWFIYDANELYDDSASYIEDNSTYIGMLENI